MWRIAFGSFCIAVLWGVTLLLSSERTAEIAYPRVNGNTDVFIVGEELVYNVRYGFISLGKITVTITGTDVTENGTAYQAKANIASYAGVPFVSLHHIYSTKMTTDFYSLWFESLEKKRNDWDVMRLNFDYTNMHVLVEEGLEGSVELTDTLEIDSFCQDGLSLFYFARGFVGIDENLTIPTLVNKDLVTTDFDFNGGRSSIKSKVVDYPIDVIELRGRANFSGIYGMNGAFRGWFTNDDAAIPIEAKLRVLIGNVTVELIEWNRPAWNPPRYTNSN
jgi:hypothetical protein